MSSIAPLDPLAIAIDDAFGYFQMLSDAKTLAEQASAFEKLSNAMSDLASYHPAYNINTGRIDV
jgi:hypothetical protein